MKFQSKGSYKSRFFCEAFYCVVSHNSLSVTIYLTVSFLPILTLYMLWSLNNNFVSCKSCSLKLNNFFRVSNFV